MAIVKKFLKTKPVCKVTFELEDLNAKDVAVVGDFNNWDANIHPLKKFKNGKYKVSIDLPTDENFEFRYIADGHYFNDIEADAYVWNTYAETENCLLEL